MDKDNSPLYPENSLRFGPKQSINTSTLLSMREEIKMSEKIQLPKFLITFEMFNEIKELRPKNAVYNEIGYKI